MKLYIAAWLAEEGYDVFLAYLRGIETSFQIGFGRSLKRFLAYLKGIETNDSNPDLPLHVSVFSLPKRD
ncbi:hypothetical protein TTE2645 [Caldanaerobacter subterraneus subsp. tengcongensis MB4]|uniref:Uncharacterized protein n=1 Tax=Caldanaerobacter subterraneus subsp. tengcongensis (strain DSM 15242 / JCM 11007 / NBRC 100824 / MB4) TaxID=273068 RepID=Q8R6Y8_CALS4|nr:hypothetical protein TTE2645 [Caldanaerobacter subterraneus subsp. tengcongensis MB4]